MAGFTKLFSSILHSTIWQEAKETKILWIAMLAMSDREGVVQASIPGLAKAAGITIQECEVGLQCLMEPDPYSRTRDHDGRRVEEVDGGWRLLNHGKYREKLSAEERREYNAKKQAEWRAKKKAKSEKVEKETTASGCQLHVNDNKQSQDIPDSRVQIPSSTCGDTPAQTELSGMPPPEEPPPAVKPPRERNPLMDAIALHAEGSDPAQVTKTRWGAIGKALAEIKEVSPDVTPEEIVARAKQYRKKYDWNLTATALASHWASCAVDVISEQEQMRRKYASM